MATISEARALPFFTDLYGSPLESGSIYIGQPGLDPVAYPAVVTSDASGTAVVAQPIRTTHGHAAAAGSLIHLFCSIPYSITVLDGAGRLVYASLNETDPVATALGTSSVQSAGSLADLRARSGSTTNQVWVDGYGMYIHDPTDSTSPENIPFVIVGSDGSRYRLSQFDANLGFLRLTGQAPTPSVNGLWASWNDDLSSGITTLTNNRGTGVGGFVFRNMDVGGVTEIGRVSMSAAGNWTASGNLVASGAVYANGGTVAVTPDAGRALIWDSANGRYSMPGAPLWVNASNVVTEAALPADVIDINVNKKLGAITIGTSTMPTPGTWTLLATISSVYLWQRTA